MIVGRRISVIDIGSNSVRLLVADVNKSGINEIYKDLNTTRLYNEISEDYSLNFDSMVRTAEAISEFVNTAESKNSDEIYMFATAAVRVASNKDEFVRIVREKTRIIPEIISEEKEAEMAFAGVGCDGLCGVIDIGGASTEIAVGDNGEIITAGSSKIGAVKCKEILITDVINQDVDNLVESVLLNNCKETISYAKERKNIKWYGVGGTITTMAAMLRNLEVYEASIINKTEISQKDVIRMITKLQSMDFERRKLVNGLDPKRADIIVFGLSILKSAMKYCDIDYITASDNDNLTGYIKLLMKEI